MISQQVLEGNWKQLKGKIRQRWGQLSGDYLDQFHGNIEELVGVIHEKTGEGREAVQGFLEGLTASSGAAFGRAADTARRYVHDATETARASAHQAATHVAEGIDEAKSLVRERPVQSLALCFGAGLVTGVLFYLLLRGKD